MACPGKGHRYSNDQKPRTAGLNWEGFDHVESLGGKKCRREDLQQCFLI